MRIQKVSNRGIIFVFEEGDSPFSTSTLVYLIQGDQHWFLCDTHLGPVSMEVVKDYLSGNGDDKPLILFNSHSDYDHVWGNCAFTGATIVAHRLCQEEMREKGESALEFFADAKNGEVSLVCPNLVFDDRLSFDEDGVEFFYTPGHTINSASCYDRKEQVLYIGDLVERPIPYVGTHRLDLYLETLEKIGQIPATVLLSAHSGYVDQNLIEENMAYIRALRDGSEPVLKDEEAGYIHAFNQKNILCSKYEEAARSQQGGRFSFDEYIAFIGEHMEGTAAELERALTGYINR